MSATKKMKTRHDNGGKKPAAAAKMSLEDLPDLAIQTIVGFLPWEDDIQCSQMCSSLHEKITSKRRELVKAVGGPIVYREERCAALMKYYPWGANWGFTVAQVRPFRFLVQTPRLGQLQINIDLENDVWDEQHNEKSLGTVLREGFPRKTKMNVKVTQKEQIGDGSGHNNSVVFEYDSFWDGFDDCDCDGDESECRWCRGYELQVVDDGEDDDNSEVEGDVSSHGQTAKDTSPREDVILREAMAAILLCCQRIATFSLKSSKNKNKKGKKSLYPSAEFLMRKGLPESLHLYFPDSFGWSKPYEDQKLKMGEIELGYVPANSMEEWWEHVTARDGYSNDSAEPFTFRPDELPWYRPGYRHNMTEW